MVAEKPNDDPERERVAEARRSPGERVRHHDADAGAAPRRSPPRSRRGPARRRRPRPGAPRSAARRPGPGGCSRPWCTEAPARRRSTNCRRAARRPARAGPSPGRAPRCRAAPSRSSMKPRRNARGPERSPEHDRPGLEIVAEQPPEAAAGAPGHRRGEHQPRPGPGLGRRGGEGPFHRGTMRRRATGARLRACAGLSTDAMRRRSYGTARNA